MHTTGYENLEQEEFWKLSVLIERTTAKRASNVYKTERDINVFESEKDDSNRGPASGAYTRKRRFSTFYEHGIFSNAGG